MTVCIILGILFFHWLFDFVFQTHEQAMNKSSSWKYLCEHTGTYSFWWCVVSVLYGIIANTSLLILLFAPITFIFHTVTDYISSRESKNFFEKKDYHNGFVVVGIDQFAHYVQLLLTAKLLNII